MRNKDLTLEEVEHFLRKEAIGSCTCLTKSPEPKYHRRICKYRLLSEALISIDLLLKIEKIRKYEFMGDE